MKASARNVSGIGIGIAALCIGGCSGGGGESLGASATGELSLALTDASVDSVESIVVQFTGVTLKPQGGPAIDIPLSDADAKPVEIDMLELTNGTYADLFRDAEVPAGVYSWIRLNVLADESNPNDSHVAAQDGGQYELRIPSSSENGLRFVSPFTITADQKTELLLDWDMRAALIEPPGQGGTYMLRPAFRLIDMTQYGTVTGTVASNLIDAAGCLNDVIIGGGNAVYVYAAADLAEIDGTTSAPNDIGGSERAPVATAMVELGPNGYAYQLLLSAPGEYRLAYTCAGEADDVETDDEIELILHPDTIVIDHGDTHTVDFQ